MISTLTPRSHTLAERCLLTVIIALAAYVRLTGMDIGWFLQDQVRDGVAALGIVSGREFPLVGPQAALSSVNLVGPFYYYLLAATYAISPDPVVGIAFLNLLNLISVYLTYRLGNEMFGAPVGLVAAALYAVFPMAVLSGKSLWNPGFIPFFATLFLFTLWRFLVGRRPWLLALVLFSLGVLLQIHMSGAIFVVLLPVALFLYRPPVRRWPLIAGLLGVALLYAPFVLYESMHGFPDLSKSLAWAGKNPSMSSWLIAWRGFWVPFLLPEQFAEALAEGGAPPLFPLVQRVELALLCAGLVALILLVSKTSDRRPYVLLGLWFTVPFAIVPHNKIGVMWYYFDILYPSQFLTIGLLSRVFVEFWPKSRLAWQGQGWAPIALWGFTGSLVLVQSWFLIDYTRTVDRTGLLKLTPDIMLSFVTSRSNVIETMPLRFKNALARWVVRHLGVDHATLERQAHGAAYQYFREDKGFLLQTVTPSASPTLVDPALHYLFLRGSPQLARDYRQLGAIGPYQIAVYPPMIKYDSWKWSVQSEPDWWRGAFDDTTWPTVTLPARRTPDPAIYEVIHYVQWPGNRVAFRGWMEVPTLRESLWLVVSFREPYPAPHELKMLSLNDRPVGVLRTMFHDSVNARTVEIVADITSAVRAGPNLVAFEIAGMKGQNGQFDLDVYELRLAAQPGAN